MAPPTLAILRALVEGAAEDPRRFTEASEARGEVARSSPIRPQITLFPLRSPTLPPATHTNCYIVGQRRLVVVEPASPFGDEQRALDAYLDEQVSLGGTIAGICATHHHPDHVGGVSHLARRLGIPVYAHEKTAALVDFPVTPLADGDLVPGVDMPLRVLHTPGHAPDHLCYLEEATHTLICGDMVAGLGTILIEPGEGSMRVYLEQLARLRDLAPSALLPSHGPMIGAAVPQLSRYIAHRLMREAKVVAGLDAGAETLDELLPRAYDDITVSLWPFARLALQAHLEKLVEEGRATTLEPAKRWRRA